jgi:hypothetical protein
MSYSKFQQYAKKFSEHYWGDYIHNIWLRYWEKHGLDIFKGKWSNRQIFKMVQNEFLNSLYKSDKFDDVIETDLETGDTKEYIPSDEPNAMDHMIYADLDKFIKEKIVKFAQRRALVKKGNVDSKINNLLTVYEFLKMGHHIYEGTNHFRNKDLAKMVGKNGVGAKQLSIFKKQIKEAILMGIEQGNPFAGSKVKVSRKITLKEWNEEFKPAHYEQDDENEWYQLMVHKNTGEGLLIRLPGDSENKYIRKYEKEQQKRKATV